MILTEETAVRALTALHILEYETNGQTGWWSEAAAEIEAKTKKKQTEMPK